MNNFSLGDLDQWESVEGPVHLPGVAGRVHEHRFELMASEHCDVYAQDERGLEPRLVAAGVGRLRCRFTCIGGVRVEPVSPGDVWFKRRVRLPQVRPESDLPSFTTVQPGGRRVATDLQRMMMMVSLNAKRREEQLAGEIARLSERLSAGEKRASSRAVVLEDDAPKPKASASETPSE